MINNQEVLAVIPARSGSKSVKDKNIRCMNDKPMLAYSIQHALASKYIDRVIVSTDSPKYAEIAREYGAEVPFLRPAEISQDSSLDIEVFEHVLKEISKRGEKVPQIVVHLRPTHPVRDPSDIDAMIEKLVNSPRSTSIRSVMLSDQTPYKMWLYNEDGEISPVAHCNISEAYNAPRQILPKAYIQNACIDVVRSETILEQHSMTGNKILGYPMQYDFDIDTEEDFLKAEQYLMLSEAIQNKKSLTIVCDIDGVIAAKTIGNDYSKSFPIQHNIDIINALYKKGFKIILFTARGYATGIDWKQTTENQMKNWGVLYSELKFGKPNADIYIDDKLFPIESLKEFCI